MPEINFSNSFDPEEKKYLAVGEKRILSLEAILSDALVIKYLNTNCAYCIKLLPTFNEIYQAIDQDMNLKSRIKIIGIGAGDSPGELDELKKKFPIPYPLIPDPEFKAHEKIGGPRVPFIIVVRKDKRGNWVVATVHSGLIFSSEHFIGELKSILSLDPETLKLKKP